MVYEHYLRSMQPPSVLIIEYTYGIYGQTFSKTTPVIANKYSFPFRINANTHAHTRKKKKKMKEKKRNSKSYR